MGKIINNIFVKEKSDAEEVVEEVLRQLADGNITDFIISARRNLTDEEAADPQNEDSESITIQHWYGDTSCMYALGMAHRMAHLINTYIDYCQIEDIEDL